MPRVIVQSGEPRPATSTEPPRGGAAGLLRQATALEARRRFDEAAAACRAVLAEDAGAFDAWFLLSGIERAAGRFEPALEAAEHAIGCARDSAPAHCRRGSLLRMLGRLEEAAEGQRRAIAIDPDYAEAHNNLGNCLKDLGHLDQALEHYERAVAIRSDYAQAHNNMGVVLRLCHDNERAVACFKKSIASKPDYAGAHFNLGLSLQQLERLPQSIAAFRDAIALRPRHADAHFHLGRSYRKMLRVEEAIASLRRAVDLDPDSPGAKFDLALLLLLSGRFGEAWDHYEVRWNVPTGKKGRRMKKAMTSVSEWTGESLDGKSVLIQSEQGLGDNIQFCRYLPLLTARGATVTFLCPPALRRLLRPLTPAVAMTSGLGQEASFDYRSTLVSLPRILGTDLQSIPRTDGAYLRVEPPRVERWREKLGLHGFKIAVCWQGNPDFSSDADRSIPLAAFAPLARLPGVRLISLQKRHGLDQLESLPADMKVELLGDDFDAGRDAFLDSAAVIAQCDLVVTSDTSIAHLAGALDARTWLALGALPDWRWLLDRTDTPWYRSLTLFRQPRIGDWAAVFAAMATRLGGELAAQSKTRR